MCISLLDNIMEVRCITPLVCLLFVFRSHADKVSKACYGVHGLSCTRHSLDCEGDTIAIQDAFFSQTFDCGTGKSDCIGVDFYDIYTDRHGELGNKETDDLYSICSLKGNCSFKAPRMEPFYFSVVKYTCIKESKVLCSNEPIEGDNISLIWNDTSISTVDETCSCNISTSNHEAIVYALDMRKKAECSKLSIISNETTYPNCTRFISYQLLSKSTMPIVLKPINVFTLLWITIIGSVNGSCSRFQNKDTGQSSIVILPSPNDAHDEALQRQENVGAIAGGVTAALIVCVVVAVVFIWLKFLRNNKKDNKPEAGKVGSLYSNAVQGSERHQRTGNNYDYATIQDGANPVGQARNDYDHADKPRTAKEGTATVEDDYNHINHNPLQSAQSSGYDTAASAAAAVKKLSTSHSVEDDYNHLGVGKINVVSSDYDITVCEDDYNHLGAGKPNVVSSGYDTTVSAAKAVENRDGEDDYDHFKRTEDRVIDSPYDTANHHGNAK